MDCEQRLPGGFVDSLERKYLETNRREAWGRERDALLARLCCIKEDISYAYELGDPIAVGGSGVICMVKDTRLGLSRAMKVPRPDPRDGELLIKLLKTETETLLQLSHENVMQLYARGVVHCDDATVPWYVMPLIDGAITADEYLKESAQDEDDALRLVTDVVRGISYLHRNKTVHLDIKPPNILVTKSGSALISDLGFAKDLNADEEDETIVGGTRGYIHPRLLELIGGAAPGSSDPDRVRGSVLRSELRYGWDLHGLGRTVLALRAAMLRSQRYSLSRYTGDSLQLIGCRLLDGQNLAGDEASGITVETLRGLAYETVSEAAHDLAKITGHFAIESKIPELRPHAPYVVNASSVAPAAMTARVESVIRAREVAGLAHMRQLGLADLVYPTATHTRLEHALGTFAITARLVSALYSDPTEPLFRNVVSEDQISAVLLAALVHDVGRYPLCDEIRDAAPDLFGWTDQRNRLLEELFGNGATAQWGVRLSDVRRILDGVDDSDDGHQSFVFRLLASIVTGPLSATKIDYVTRDAVAVGVGIGSAENWNRLVDNLVPAIYLAGAHSRAEIGVHERAVSDAEAVAFARYGLHSRLFWHHRIRATNSMVRRITWELLAAEPKRINARRSEFFDFVYRLLDPTRQDGRRLRSPVERPTGTHISHAEHEVLEWLSKRGGTGAGYLFDALSRGAPFRRVLRLGPGVGSEEVRKLAWRACDAPQMGWHQRLAMERHVQSAILAHLRSTQIGSAAVERLILDGQTKPVILLDMPPRKNEVPLWYVPDVRFQIGQSPQGRHRRAVHAPVWSSLQKEFRDSIGRVHLYCAREHADALINGIGETTLEGFLEAALHAQLK